VHQCLPTRTNLLNRGISCEDSCVSCDLFAETQMHTFFVCSKANQCWNLLGLNGTIQARLPSANNFTTMLFALFDRLQVQQLTLTTMTLWSLWKSRNTKLWEAIDTSPSAIVSQAKDRLVEWGCMQRGKVRSRNDHTKQPWIKPPPGMIKCNVDATSFNGNSIMGYSMCFRDSTGLFLLGKSDYFASSTTVLKVESLGLLEAIKAANSNDMRDVMFETDSKVLFDALHTTSTLANEFGDLVSHCRSLLLSRNDFVVSYVRRQANKVAHSIARASLSNPSPNIFCDVLTTLYPFIMNEMN